MKSLSSASMIVLLASLSLVAGCTLETPATVDKRVQGGKDLIINEVFTISPDKYYSYSWIELYNPTTKKIKWFDETKPAAGFAVGSSGAIIHTSNDGGAWSDSLSAAQNGSLNAISMSNADTGYAVGNNGKILKVTKNSVQALISGTLANLNGISAAADQQSRTAYAVGDNGTILRTVNRGATWLPPLVPPTTNNLRSVFFVSFQNIYACGDNGTIIKSTNAGTGWSSKIVPEPYRPLSFYSVNFNADTGWVTGDDGTILVSTNGGGQWVPETSHVHAALRGGFFPPSRDPFRRATGWVVGDSGVILRTSDNGGTWTRATTGTSGRLNSVTFADSLRGWAFGDGGLILSTANAGRTWHQQPGPTGANLHGSAFIPLIVRVVSQYLLEMVAQRRAFFFDPATGTINFDYFTKIDSGTMLFDPQILVNFGLSPPSDINPGAFAVITSDSDKFKDHTNLGPGDGTVIPNSIGYYADPTSPFGARPVLWTLLPSGEIRLVKRFLTQVIATQQFLGLDSVVIDVVRYGNFRPTPDPWPNNQPAGFIPEWYSLARFSDDYGDIPSRENTNYSFYMAKDPIPRWYSQLSHTSK
ncbi:MAG TPA: YCF48-related protein [Bacteroidota bacterium]